MNSNTLRFHGIKDALVEADSLYDWLVFRTHSRNLKTLADFTVTKDALVDADSLW